MVSHNLHFSSHTYSIFLKLTWQEKNTQPISKLPVENDSCPSTSPKAPMAFQLFWPFCRTQATSTKVLGWLGTSPISFSTQGNPASVVAVAEGEIKVLSIQHGDHDAHKRCWVNLHPALILPLLQFTGSLIWAVRLQAKIASSHGAWGCVYIPPHSLFLDPSFSPLSSIHPLWVLLAHLCVVTLTKGQGLPSSACLSCRPLLL